MIKVISVTIGVIKPISDNAMTQIQQQRTEHERRLCKVVSEGYEIIDCTAAWPDGYIVMIYTLQKPAYEISQVEISPVMVNYDE